MKDALAYEINNIVLCLACALNHPTFPHSIKGQKIQHVESNDLCELCLEPYDSTKAAKAVAPISKALIEYSKEI